MDQISPHSTRKIYASRKVQKKTYTYRNEKTTQLYPLKSSRTRGVKRESFQERISKIKMYNRLKKDEFKKKDGNRHSRISKLSNISTSK